MSDATPSPLGVDRQTFLSRIRASLEHAETQRPTEPAPAVDPAVARLASADDDLVTMFAERAAKVGMTITQTTESDWVETVLNVLREANTRTAVVGISDAGRREAVESAVRGASIDLYDWRCGEGFDRQYDIDAGVTDVHTALAETGTLVCNSDADHGRGLSLLPPLHVAVVRASDILPDMIDYWQRMAGLPPRELPSNMNFITGPSKTADIEGELVTGVHGPEAVTVVLVTDG